MNLQQFITTNKNLFDEHGCLAFHRFLQADTINKPETVWLFKTIKKLEEFKYAKLVSFIAMPHAIIKLEDGRKQAATSSTYNINKNTLSLFSGKSVYLHSIVLSPPFQNKEESINSLSKKQGVWLFCDKSILINSSFGEFMPASITEFDLQLQVARELFLSNKINTPRYRYVMLRMVLIDSDKIEYEGEDEKGLVIIENN